MSVSPLQSDTESESESESMGLSTPPLYHSPPRRAASPSPTLHGALSMLATLTNSNHTLSPFTRSLSHFTVRSGPRRAACTTTCSVRQAATAAGAAHSDGGDSD